MKIVAFRGLALIMGLFLAARASAGIVGVADFSSVPDGANFDYTIHLYDTGTTNIGTFWFSWVPGQDYMAHNPISVNNPTGWTSNITHGGSSDGYAIQWVATTNAITSGNSLDFTFTSAETPAQLAGNSSFFAHPLEGTSFVYVGAPEGDPGFKLTAVPVPEPSSMILVGLAVGGFGLRLWIGRRKKAAVAVAV